MPLIYRSILFVCCLFTEWAQFVLIALPHTCIVTIVKKNGVDGPGSEPRYTFRYIMQINLCLQFRIEFFSINIFGKVNEY